MNHGGKADIASGSLAAASAGKPPLAPVVLRTVAGVATAGTRGRKKRREITSDDDSATASDDSAECEKKAVEGMEGAPSWALAAAKNSARVSNKLLRKIRRELDSLRSDVATDLSSLLEQHAALQARLQKLEDASERGSRPGSVGTPRSDGSAMRHHSPSH